MPHGESWFSVLFGDYYTVVESALNANLGHTWLGHSDISAQHVFAWLFVLICVVAIAIVARAKVRDVDDALVPEATLSLRTFVELLVEATYGQMTDMMGSKAAKYFLPLIGTCAFMILFSNTLGLVPGFSPPTSNLNTTLACALVIFFTTHIYGVKAHGLPYFKHFFGPILKWYALPLMLLMLLVETISHIARPMSLSIRLMANMTADHAVLAVFLGLVPFWLPVPVAIYLLGVVVVVVQTLVFCLLSTVYISMAVAHDDH